MLRGVVGSKDQPDLRLPRTTEGSAFCISFSAISAAQGPALTPQASYGLYQAVGISLAYVLNYSQFL